MGEFFAWAATGLVTGLERSAETRNAGYAGQNASPAGQAPAAAHLQRFFLRQRDGLDIEILLIDSGIAFRDGDAVTAVWAAGRGSPYGHCIYLENNTTGAIARLPENVALIRPKAASWKVLAYGLLTTVLAAVALLLWMFLQRGIFYLQHNMFWISAAVALGLFFVIGVVVSKLVFDYIKADDEQKIWIAADKALANARRVLLQKPVIGSYR
jgi:uncharacterized membrane protein